MTGEQWLAMLVRIDLTDEEHEFHRHGELTMNEVDWDCASPAIRFRYMWSRTSERKLRLYLCGGCRLQTHLYYHRQSFGNLNMAEKYADGLASNEERHDAEWSAEAWSFGYDFDIDFWDRYPDGATAVIESLVKLGGLSESALTGGEWIVDEVVRTRIMDAARMLEFAASPIRINPVLSDVALTMDHPEWPGRWLSDCVFGNPFRTVIADPAWLTDTVQSIASAIYQDRAFDRLPILADALEEAGCTNADVLLHCRQPGEHVRGCWVVDLVLGKE